MLRKFRKAQESFLIKAILVTIALSFFSFIFFYWGAGGSGGSKNPNVVALVGKDIISLQEFNRAYQGYLEYYRETMKEEFSRDKIKELNLHRTILESLIEERLIVKAASDMGISITDEELSRDILKLPYFTKNGVFHRGLYKQRLRAMGMTPSQFEEGRKRELLAEKIKNLIASGITVTDEEAVDEFIRKNLRLNLEYVKMNTDDIQGDIEIDEPAAVDFFNNNTERFRRPEERRVEFLKLTPEELMDDVILSKEQALNYYEENLDRYTESEQVRARHILFKVPPDAEEVKEDSTREKALEILKKVEAGEDFEKLAREYSEDNTAEMGGDLGYFTRGKMVKPFEKVAFSLDPGSTSDPVRTKFGYHIIKVEDHKPEHVTPFMEVEADIIEELKIQEAKRLAYTKAKNLADEIRSQTDPLQLEWTPTNFFSKYGHIEGIDPARPLTAAAFSLKKGELSDPVRIKDDYYLIKLDGIKEAYTPDFKEARDEVFEVLKEEKRGELVWERAMELHNASKNGDDITIVLKSHGLELNETGLFGVSGSYIPTIGNSQELKRMAISLTEDNPFPEDPFRFKDDIIVFKLKETEGLDWDKFEDEKEDIKESVFLQKKRLSYERWLERARKNYRININEDALESFI